MLSYFAFNMALVLITVALHELGHMAVALGCGMEVRSLEFNWRQGVATRIRISPDPVQNALTYFGGPLFNILALAFVPLGWVWVLMNLVVGIGNLLPIPYSDGSQILVWLQHKEKPCSIQP